MMRFSEGEETGWKERYLGDGEPTFSQLILPSIFFLLVSADEELGFFVYHPCVFGAEDVGVYTGWVGR